MNDVITLKVLQRLSKRLHEHAHHYQMPVMSDSDGPFYAVFLPNSESLVRAAYEAGLRPFCIWPPVSNLVTVRIGA